MLFIEEECTMSRESIINNSKVMIGRNEYSMNINKRVCALTPYSDGKYYSDCSSFASACFMAGGHDVGWNNTSSFCTNNLFYTVPITQKLYDTLTGIQFSDLEDKYGWIVKLS